MGLLSIERGWKFSFYRDCDLISSRIQAK